jgi:hypothetical protein
MGTRNLTAVMHNGRYGIAQYGQWDGNPGGQGMTVLSFLRGMDRESFTAKVDATKFLTDGDFEVLQKEYNAIGAKAFYGKYPELTRDTAAEILAIVATAEPGIGLREEIDFAGDSLMCEWAYVIDLDKDTFEVFEGFNKAPLDAAERFAKSPVCSDYKPVKFLKSWPLAALPSDDEFLAIERDEDEE